MLIDRLLIEEECGCGRRLSQKVLSEGRDPTKDLESSIRLEHKEGDGLLCEESNKDGRPRNLAPFNRNGIEENLEDD